MLSSSFKLLLLLFEFTFAFAFALFKFVFANFDICLICQKAIQVPGIRELFFLYIRIERNPMMTEETPELIRG
jgi:hypothetical protein